MNTKAVTRIPLDRIAPDPGQPRKHFDAAALEELAGSIKSNGLIQPVTVRVAGKGRFIIVAGERRWRAHCLLRDRKVKGFTQIPCIVVKAGKTVDVRVKQLVENISRQDMTILEEADAFAELAKLGLSPEDIAERLGLATFRVVWRLQLQNLSPEIRRMVEGGHLDRQQALELARLQTHRDQARVVRMVNRGELTGWKALRNAVDAILQGHTAADLFGEASPVASVEDLATVRKMEARIERIVAVVAAGWKDGECVIASKVSPDRAGAMADRLAALKTAIAHMERELRNSAAQAKIVLQQ